MASNTISQIISKAGTAIIAIFLISVLTNYLTVELYGLYSKVYNYVGIFVFLADLGLYAITIREITNNKEKSSSIVGNVMSLRLILGIFILILAVAIAFFLPGYNSILALISIFIASIFTILQLLNSSILALMQANMKVEYSAFTLILGKLVNLFGTALVAYVFYPKQFIENSDYFSPFIYIMIVGVISVFINTILNYFYARKIVKFGFAWDFDYIKHIFKISVPYGIALFLSVVYFKMDIMILSIMEEQTIADRNISLYSLPMKIVEVIMVIGGFYMTSMLPSITEAFKKKDEKTLTKLTDISFKVLFMFSSMVFILGIMFRDYIIKIIANDDYLNVLPYSSSDAFLVVFAVILFYFISLVFIYLFVASENQNKLLKINIIVTIFNFVGNILLIPKYSFMGAGFVTLLSQILLFILGYFGTKKLVKFNFSYKFLLSNIIFSTIIYFFGTYILKNFSFIGVYKYGLYIDFVLYGGIFFVIYIIFFYFIYKKFLKKIA
ncbi:oligosaccharide flippase family protein [Candidatus Gracilibacteria bacterium]|nr:oligosaccharide flippase family protein [Candidatus Gracilibacteria bacterium]